MKMKSSEEDPISNSSNLISNLTQQLIPQIQHLKGKWSLINSKLTNLQTQLTDFSHFNTSLSNSLSNDLLNSLFNTLNDAVLLAYKCQYPTLNSKLKTQNDVDSLLTRLDQHVKDGDVLIKSGVLQDAVVLVSKKEAIRAESRNLLTRLQLGSSESRNSAIDSLLTIVNEDDKNVMIAVAQGAIPVLIRLLDSNCIETKEKAVAAIARISTVESSKHLLAAEGLLLLNHLIRVLDSGSCHAKEKACVALQGLSCSRENARSIGSRGGVASLLEVCQAGTPASQASAAGVLRNLAVFGEIKENLIEENAVFVLMGLAISGTALAQENVIGCLSGLVSGNDELKLLVAREGGIECLKNYWDSVSDFQSLEVAVEFLRELCLCERIGHVVVSEGFVDKLVGVLSCGVLRVRIAAARAVYELGFIANARRMMGECGCVAPLVKMLDGKAVEEKEAAAKALSVLVLCANNRRIVRKDERGLVSVVQLLDPSIQISDKKCLVDILASLVHSKKCRKQVVAAGACVHLQKLVDLDVEGAKKLLDSLRHSKIWGVFSRP